VSILKQKFYLLSKYQILRNFFLNMLPTRCIHANGETFL